MKKSIKAFLSYKETGIFFTMIGIIIVLSIITPYFLTFNNILNLSRQIAYLGIMSVGLLLVLISGNIDLSLGSTYGLSAVIAALTMLKFRNTFIALIVGLAVGALIGLINGVLTEKVKVPSFITTFGTLYVGRGLSLIITGGYPVTLFTEGVTQDTHPFFHYIGRGLLFGQLPMQFIIMLLTMIIGGFILHKTVFGLRIYSTGGNVNASYIAGINVNKTRIIAFVISGTLAALAGILSLSFIGTIMATAGDRMEFEAIAAVVIGGTTLTGGEGSILGILIGVIILGLIKNGLILMGVDPFWQLFVIGLITIGAVAYASFTWQRRQEGRVKV